MGTLRQDFDPYIDGNSLYAPNLVPPGVLQGSDNGPMFTAEYYTLLVKNRVATLFDRVAFAVKIGRCIDLNGLLNRVPANLPNRTQEQVDDYYAVLNGCVQVQNVEIPRQFLRAAFKYKGSFNNVIPGQWTASSFLARQPQLLAAMLAAAYPSNKNLFHILVRLAALPLFLYAALVIATSCVYADPEDADKRRLAWHLIGTVSSASLLCKLASLLWFRRLDHDYGPLGMKAVAAIYYQPQGPDNPYAKYWVT